MGRRNRIVGHRRDSCAEVKADHQNPDPSVSLPWLTLLFREKLRYCNANKLATDSTDHTPGSVAKDSEDTAGGDCLPSVATIPAVGSEVIRDRGTHLTETV